MTGRPRRDTLSRCSTAANMASRSTWAITVPVSGTGMTKPQAAASFHGTEASHRLRWRPITAYAGRGYEALVQVPAGRRGGGRAGRLGGTGRRGGVGAPPVHGAGLLEDRGVPARLDPGRGGGDPAARGRARLR